eukprot:scaffold570_cov401-Pavlova_lutheri.AAC.3
MGDRGAVTHRRGGSYALTSPSGGLRLVPLLVLSACTPADWSDSPDERFALILLVPFPISRVCRPGQPRVSRPSLRVLIEKLSTGPVLWSLFSMGLVVQVVPSDQDSRTFGGGCG